MTLTEKIDLDLINALKSKDELRVLVLRTLKSDLKYKMIDLGNDLNEEDELAVVSSAAKKRSEAIVEYKKADRPELLEQEAAEYNILKEYLPQQLTEDQIMELVEKSISETGASSMGDLGAVMRVLMPQVKGRADGKVVNSAVKAKLSNM